MTATAQHAADALEGFAKLIESVPEVDDSQTDLQAVSEAPSTPKPSAVRLSSGWGQKYVETIELRGERWLEEFENAKGAVAACGIVIFLGGRGPGKTQMAAEVARAGSWPADVGEWNGNQNVHGKTALYCRALDLFLDLRDAAQNNSGTSEKKVLAKLEKPGLVVIDEFQERGGSEWENRIVCNLIDKRYAANRPTILIANLSREDMARNLSDSIKDRIRENGKAIIFNWESYRKQPTP